VRTLTYPLVAAQTGTVMADEQHGPIRLPPCPLAAVPVRIYRFPLLGQGNHAALARCRIAALKQGRLMQTHLQ